MPKTKPKNLITPAEYARRRGVSRQAVAAAINEGRITLVDGKIDPERADAEWAERTTGRRGGTLADARRRLTEAKAALAELELSIRRGEYMAIQDVLAEHRKMLERLRAVLLAAPGKYAHRVLGIETLRQAESALRAIIDDLMLALSEVGDATPDEEVS